MFRTPTVIVLGAGASYEFGAPLGEGLWSGVVDATSQMVSVYTDYANKNFAPTIDGLLRDHQYRHPGAAAYFAEIRDLFDEPRALDAIMEMKESRGQLGGERGFDLVAVMRKIAARVSQANFHTSVDDFLRDNPSLVRPLRVLIAWLIFSGFYERQDTHEVWKFRDLPYRTRFGNPHNGQDVENWIHRFVGSCRPLLQSGASVTPITVVSFNYDLLLETVLGKIWDVAERKVPPFSECFRFVYPYGRFSEFPEIVRRPGVWLNTQAKSIGLATGDDSVDGKEVRAAVSDAKQIFAVGFSFTETNIRLLGLKERYGTKLFVQNYMNKDTRLTRILGKYRGATTDSAPLAQLVRDGFFEQSGPSARPRSGIAAKAGQLADQKTNV